MKRSVLVVLTTLLLSFGVIANESLTPPEKVNINTASTEQLQEGLVGVGERNAEEIIKYRKEHGAFRSLDDFDKVKYVGPKLLDKNKDRIAFE